MRRGPARRAPSLLFPDPGRVQDRKQEEPELVNHTSYVFVEPQVRLI